MQWAVKAYDEAETYLNLICSLDNQYLKLTRKDDLIYNTFRNHFPGMDVGKVTDADLKEKGAKEKWREFLMLFEKKLDDYNHGTLLRVDAHGDLSNENTILVLRTQFLAIEIARNREGYNRGIRQKMRALKAQKDNENLQKQEELKHEEKSDDTKAEIVNNNDKTMDQQADEIVNDNDRTTDQQAENS